MPLLAWILFASYFAARGLYDGVVKVHSLRSKEQLGKLYTPNKNTVYSAETFNIFGVAVTSYSLFRILPTMNYMYILNQVVTIGFGPIFSWIGTFTSKDWFKLTLKEVDAMNDWPSPDNSSTQALYIASSIDFTLNSKSVLSTDDKSRNSEFNRDEWDVLKDYQDACLHKYIVSNQNKAIQSSFYISYQKSDKSSHMYKVLLKENCDLSVNLSIETINSSFKKTLYPFLFKKDLYRYTSEESGPESIKRYLENKSKIYISKPEISGTQNTPLGFLEIGSLKDKTISHTPTSSSKTYALDNGLQCQVFSNIHSQTSFDIHFKKMSLAQRALNLFSKTKKVDDIVNALPVSANNPSLRICVNDSQVSDTVLSFIDHYKTKFKSSEIKVIEYGEKKVRNIYQDRFKDIKVVSLIDSQNQTSQPRNHQTNLPMHTEITFKYREVRPLHFVKFWMMDTARFFVKELIESIKIDTQGNIFQGLATLAAVPLTLVKCLIKSLIFFITLPFAVKKARDEMIYDSAASIFTKNESVNVVEKYSPKLPDTRPSLWSNLSVPSLILGALGRRPNNGRNNGS